MASSVTIRRYILVILIICTVIFSCISGEDDYEPEVGPIGKHPSYEEGGEDHGYEGNGEDHGHEEGVEDGGHGGGEDHGHEGSEGHDDGEGNEDHGHEGGEGHDEGHGGGGGDPAHIVDGGLLCFHEKHIYSICEESCRLSATGDLHVLSDQVDEFCNGPCLEETNLVLDCLEGIMEHFLFYNQATTQDVRDTIHVGCGHGEHRGDFDVGEHIEDEGSGSIGSEPKFPLLFVIVITFICQILVLL